MVEVCVGGAFEIALGIKQPAADYKRQNQAGAGGRVGVFGQALLADPDVAKSFLGG